MQVFLAAWSARGGIGDDGAAILRSVVRDIGVLDTDELWTWTAPSGRAALHAIAHDAGRTGGVTHHGTDGSRAALFSGRPIMWDGDDADGEAPLAASVFLERPDRWAHRLDGRCVVLRYDDEDGNLTVRTDLLGAYPVYAGRHGDTSFVSNNAAVLRRAIGSAGVRREVLATFAGVGWSLGGVPLWEGVDRLPRGALCEWSPAETAVRPLLPLEEIARWFDSGLDRGQAAADLTAVIRAGGRWPGRPVALPLTGGRDSRVIFAGALEAGVDFAAETSALPHLPGYPDTADVRIARRLCEIAGRPHKVNMPEARAFEADRALAALALASPGTFSLASIAPGTAAQFAAGRPANTDPVRILLSGANGEMARTYYGLGGGETNAQLVQRFEGRLIPGYPPSLLTSDARAVVRDQLESWVTETREHGVAANDAPDAFYLLERMSNWAGPLHGILEFGSDVFAPLWSPRMVRHQVSLPGEERTAARFHALLLEQLAPAIASVEYEGATYKQGHVATLLKRAKQVRAEVKRRTRRTPLPASDPLPGARRLLQERVGRDTGHPVWDVVDLPRAETLLRREPARLDPRSRDQVWRLATALLAEPG